MSVNPTQYDLVQDGRLDNVESLVKTSYSPPSATEYSYPVVDQPMNDEQWQYVTLGLGDGVLDEGGRPYWLRDRENTNNTLKITTSTTTNTAQALVRGFYHRLMQDRTFTVPAVSSKTTYYFCLVYDPSAMRTATGPVSLKMITGAPLWTLGRFYTVLWELDRLPNQLLTDAVVRRVRPKITPAITVNNEADRPNPAKVLWGTRVLCTDNNTEYRAAGASDESGGPTFWTPISDPEWIEYPDTPTYKWPGHGYRRAIQRRGKSRRIRGRITPADGKAFTPSSNGYLMWTLADGDNPKSGSFSVGWGNRNSSGVAPAVQLDIAAGEVRAYPTANCNWIDLGDIQYDVE